MSYTQVKTVEPAVDDVHEEFAGPSRRSGEERVAHAYFKSSASLHTAISVAAGTVMMLFGYEQGVFGGIIVGQDFIEYFNHPSPAMQGFVTSVYDLGCFVGALLTLFVGEKLGRRWTMLVFTVIMGAGILIQTGSHNMTQMVWGRFIAGIGNGGNTSSAPVWHVETSHQSQKGIAVVKEMSVNVLGFVISNFITLFCSAITTEAQWRFPLGVQMVFVAIILVMVYILPESPRWLLAHRREDEARRVLSMLNDHDIKEEFEEIRTSIQAEQAAQASWTEMFKGGLGTRRVFLGMMLQLAQQLSGVNALGYYLPVVLHRSVGLSETIARWVAAANAVSYFLTTTTSIAFVDKVGRRPLLMIGAAVMAVAFFGVSTGVGIGGALPGTTWPGIIAVIFIWMYFTAFSSGWISIPWLYAAEVNGLSMRTKATSLSTACDWLGNYLVVQATPPGIHHLKWGYYLIYGVVNVIWVPLIYYFLVETRGRSLEETDRWFHSNPGWLVHKADHSPAARSGKPDGLKLDTLRRGEDSEAMMADFELASDEESPVTRRASFPHFER
ncbi:hypothetical protein WHR41_05233 [Cladosporium halotolerans]|uniref:Major facilitator superfamily (MFS) profile domain-containing protein n=1 Tax=Cladosporium halotolerans TaxID=1052096 RepID=A0AB34KRN6_9PEZI